MKKMILFIISFFLIAVLSAQDQPQGKISLVIIGDGCFAKSNSLTKRIKLIASKRIPDKSLTIVFPYSDSFSFDWSSLTFFYNYLNFFYNKKDEKYITVLNINDLSTFDKVQEDTIKNTFFTFAGQLLRRRNHYLIFIQRGNKNERIFQSTVEFFGIPTIQLDQANEDELSHKLIDMIAKGLPEPNRNHQSSPGLVYSYEISNYDSNGWIDWQWSPVNFFPHVLKCHSPAADMTCRFKGSTFGILGVSTPDSSDILISVDGGPYIRKKMPVSDKPEMRASILVGSLSPGEHEIRLRMPDDAFGKVILIGRLCLNGTPIYEKNTLKTAEYIDHVYSKMPQLKPFPTTDDATVLKRTSEALSSHRDMTIVMLGDSIINDTAASQFHLLLERKYGNKIKIVKSVRGGADIAYFVPHLKDYVLQYNPTLVIIGGVSSKSTNAYRAAARYIKKHSTTDVLLLPKTFCKIISNRKIWEETSAQSMELQKIADEEGVAYFPMHIYYRRYIENNNVNVLSLMRDHTHHNDRGSQLLGRLLYLWIDSQVK